MNLVPGTEAVYAFEPVYWVSGAFVIVAAIFFLAVLVFGPGGRHRVLEQIVALNDFGAPTAFHGTLAVEEIQPGSYLRLRKSTQEARRLQFWYRWIVGWGSQAKFDEVTFDGTRHLVELKEEEKFTRIGFSEYTAVRMRERGGGRSAEFLWHLELIGSGGCAMPFVTSAPGKRKAIFEQTAPVAKAISAIMGLPTQVIVAHVWTPGWPPKNRPTGS
jgi:hypothetical protein